jgi:DNA repair protein RadC
MKIKDIPKENRPREKLIKSGAENLSDAEILALILEKGTKKENVIEMSQRLIDFYTLESLSECSLKELRDIDGIGFAKACQIKALFEFNKRHNQSKNKKNKISCAEDVFNLMHERLKDEKQEHFYIIMLDTKNNIIQNPVLITKGILDASIVHPREIFKPAIKNSASKIILVHNHPSGDPTPSREDIEITHKLISFGDELGIKVLDSIVIGRNEWRSWEEKR